MIVILTTRVPADYCPDPSINNRQIHNLSHSHNLIDIPTRPNLPLSTSSLYPLLASKTRRSLKSEKHPALALSPPQQSFQVIKLIEVNEDASWRASNLHPLELIPEQ